jgi:hypothetical protein
MKLKSSMAVAAIISLALGGCTPVSPTGPLQGGEVQSVDIEGNPFLVQPVTNRSNVWAARRDEAKEPLFRIMANIDRRRWAIAAIEEVSGCKVAPETVDMDRNQTSVFAEVSC